tara:strand:- start:171 stop:308 length:138 start_codon:yes stop_codon:yes gene_type:complete
MVQSTDFRALPTLVSPVFSAFRRDKREKLVYVPARIGVYPATVNQ